MSTTDRFKAVVFDYGGVLCHPPRDEDFEDLAAVAGLDRETFAELYGTTREPLDRGVMSSSDYWPHFAMHARTALTPAQIGKLAALDLRVWQHMNESMLALVSELREAGVRTAILSNMQPDLLRILRSDAAWLNAFDVLVFSCDLQMVKPEPEIYRHLLATLAALPDEVIFIDDTRVNVEAARAMGIHALQYTSLPELRSQLRGLLAQAASVPSSSRAAVALSAPESE